MTQARRTHSPRRNGDSRGNPGNGFREIILLIFIITSLYLFVSLATYHPLDPSFWQSGSNEEIANQGGVVGAYFASLLLNLFGYFAYLFAGMLAYVGWLVYHGRHHEFLVSPRQWVKPVLGFMITLSAGCGLVIVHFAAETHLLPSHAGGVLGVAVGSSLESVISQTGATLVLLGLFFTGITLLTGVSWLHLMDILGYHTLYWSPRVWRFLQRRIFPVVGAESLRAARVSSRVAGKVGGWSGTMAREAWHQALDHWDRFRHGPEEYEEEEEPKAEPPKSAAEPAKRPTMNTPPRATSLNELMPRTTQPTKESAPPSPKAAKPAAEPSELFTLPYTPPAPEKPTPRVENIVQHTATPPAPSAPALRDLFRDERFLAAEGPLSIALGQDANQQWMVVDLTRMPHLLLAGGVAEDVDQGLHGLLLCLLHQCEPSQLRLILMDSKRKVFARHAHLPHLLTPVLNQPARMLEALHWCVGEMERRYRIMADLGVRNIDGYHRKLEAAAGDLPENREGLPVRAEPLPYVVVVVRELADLIHGNEQDRELEERITRLTQKARASGIHLVVASATPTVQVISGLMKSSFPTRVAFRVANAAESRNILGEPGAEQLTHDGEMLYLTPGTGTPVRLQGARVDAEEIRLALEQLKQQGTPNYLDLGVA